MIRTGEWDMDEKKHATAMKQLRDRIRPTLTVTYQRVRDGSDQQHWLKPSCETHERSIAGCYNFFLHEHVPRGQMLGKEFTHDLPDG